MDEEMKKQVVKIEGKYAARFKKWYHLQWRYIGVRKAWREDMLSFNTERYTMHDTKELADQRLIDFFPKEV